MERVRQAMETALAQKWVPPTRSAGIAPVVRRKKEILPDRVTKNHRSDSYSRVPISRDVLARNGLVAANKNDADRGAYSVLQASVLERMTEQNWSSIGVTGPATGTGKTLTAANLSIALATQASRRVLLLDLNLRQPNIHSLFEHEPKFGLEDCLFDGLSLGDVAFSPAISDLAVLPTKNANRNATQILRSESLRNFLNSIRRDDPNRIIVADLPRLTDSDLARAVGKLLDGMLIVAEETTTTESHLRSALSMVDESQLLGTVLNRATKAS